MLILLGGSLFMLTLLAAPVDADNANEARGTVTTVAGNGNAEYTGDGGPATEAGVGGPFGVVVGPDGALYICEISNHVIRRLDRKTGRLTTVAGTGEKGYSGDGGPATQARLNEPYEVRFDPDGHMYFVEMQNHVVRRVDAKTGVITTVVGSGKPGRAANANLPRTQIELNRPHSICFDNRGKLYICDIGNHRILMLRYRQERGAEVFAGTGERKPTRDGESIHGNPLNGPRALDFDGDNLLWLTLREGNRVYAINLEASTIHHIAGTGRQGYTGDGGPAKKAQLAGPKGVAVGPGGDIYLADTESHTIRVIRKKTGVIETVIGDGKRGDGPDGDPKRCRLDRPHGVYVDREGRIYIGDSNNNKVRMLRP